MQKHNFITISGNLDKETVSCFYFAPAEEMQSVNV